MHRVRNLNEVLTGVFLILVSLVAFYLAWPLSSHTEVGPGAGYVPRMFAFVQLVLGGMLIGHGLLYDGESSERWHFRPLLLVLVSVAFFAITIERLGLVVALTGLVLISCLANRDTTFREALALAVGSVVVSALLFVKLLGLAIQMWPPIF